MNTFKNRQGMALMGVLMVMTFLGILMIVAFFSASTYTTSSLVKEGSDRALYCAQAGVEEALRTLRSGSGFGWTGVSNVAINWTDTSSIVTNVGHYSVTQVNPPGPIPDGIWFNIPFRVTGVSPSLDGANALRNIEIVIRAMNPAACLFNSNSQISIGGGATINGDIFANRVKFTPPPSGKLTHVTGDVNYITSVEGEDHTRVQIDGDIESIDNVMFPSIAMGDFEAKAHGAWKMTGSGYHEIKDQTLDGNAIDNQVIYVEGDLYIGGSNGVKVKNKSVAIAATGNIYITGHLKKIGDAQIGLFSMNKVYVADTVTSTVQVQAFVMAQNGFEAKGSALYPKDPDALLDFFGSICIFGNSTGSSAINCDAFPLRSYVYDSSLRTNNTIPGVTYFADLVEFAVAGDPL